MSETKIHDKIMSQTSKLLADFMGKYQIIKIVLNSELYNQLKEEISKISGNPVADITKFMDIPLEVDNFLVPSSDVALLIAEEIREGLR
jgi:hypothetical protein